MTVGCLQRNHDCAASMQSICRGDEPSQHNDDVRQFAGCVTMVVGLHSSDTRGQRTLDEMVMVFWSFADTYLNLTSIRL